MPEALAVGKACYARLYSSSRLNKREPLTALGSYQEEGEGGGGLSASIVSPTAGFYMWNCPLTTARALSQQWQQPVSVVFSVVRISDNLYDAQKDRERERERERAWNPLHQDNNSKKQGNPKQRKYRRTCYEKNLRDHLYFRITFQDPSLHKTRLLTEPNRTVTNQNTQEVKWTVTSTLWKHLRALLTLRPLSKNRVFIKPKFSNETWKTTCIDLKLTLGEWRGVGGVYTSVDYKLWYWIDKSVQCQYYTEYKDW